MRESVFCHNRHPNHIITVTYLDLIQLPALLQWKLSFTKYSYICLTTNWNNIYECNKICEKINETSNKQHKEPTDIYLKILQCLYIFAFTVFYKHVYGELNIPYS